MFPLRSMLRPDKCGLLRWLLNLNLPIFAKFSHSNSIWVAGMGVDELKTVKTKLRACVGLGVEVEVGYMIFLKILLPQLRLTYTVDEAWKTMQDFRSITQHRATPEYPLP